MKTAIIVLHFGKKELTKTSLKKLKKNLKGHKLILINNTKNNASDLTKIIPNTKLINNNKNFGFSKGVNQGINKAFKSKDIDSVMLLNNDLHFTFGNIDQLRKTLFSDNQIGIVSPTLHHSGNQYDWGGSYNKWTGNAKHKNFPQKPKKEIEVDHVAGAAMLIKKSLIEKIGLFDERYFLYFEDLDFCLRTRKAGYKIIINPETIAKHSISKSSTPIKRTLYQWSSHTKFLIKHIPRLNVYPTAIFYNIIFYPLNLIKLILRDLTKQ